MAKLVVMPKLGLTMTEGLVSRWLKAEGDAVKEGEPLFEVETDKLTNTIEATASGTLLKILAKEGNTLPCLAGVAVIGEPNEDISELVPGEAPKAEAPGGRAVASPAAKKLAKELDGTTGRNIEIKNCPVCGQPLKKRNGRFGEFWGCMGFPTCRYTENI